jgi:hypothetical protein
MSRLRTLISKLPLPRFTRPFASVHDITIKANDKIVGSMERNSTFTMPGSIAIQLQVEWERVGVLTFEQSSPNPSRTTPRAH